MQPTPSDVHVNTALSMMSVAFMQSAEAFIADDVFPNIPVNFQSDRYYVYNRGDFNRDDVQLRAPATESAGAGYKLDNTPSYYAPVYALHKDIDDQTRNNSDTVLKPDSDATQFLTNKFLIKRERTWATQYFGTGIWGTNYTGVSSGPTGTQFLQWNSASSTPIENMRALKTLVHLAGGFAPNKLVMGQQVWDILIDHPDFIDRVKYGQTANGPGTRPAKASLDIMAQILELDQVLVMSSIYNTAGEDDANAIDTTAESNAFIGGKNVLLCYAAPAPGLMVPSAGYTFSWTGMYGNGPAGQRVKTYRMEHLEADRIEMEMAYTQQLVSAQLGAFVSGIVQ